MRGPTIHDESGLKDPLLRAIAELRDQVDRMIDDQKVVLGGLLGGLVEEAAAPERGAEIPPGPVATAAEPDPAPRARRLAQPAAFDRLDDPSPTPPRPASPAPAPAPAAEPPAASRPEDARERLDALAKHLDRKLKQAGGPPADSPARPPE